MRQQAAPAPAQPDSDDLGRRRYRASGGREATFDAHDANPAVASITAALPALRHRQDGPAAEAKPRAPEGGVPLSAISAADPGPDRPTAAPVSRVSPADPLAGAAPAGPDPAAFPDFEDHCWRGVVPDEVLEVYRPYRRATRLGRRPALLAIDLYNCVFPDGPLPVREAVRVDPRSCGVHAWEAIGPLRRLFDLARAAGLPVFYTTTETRPEANPSRVKATNRPEGGDPAHDYAIRADFTPRPGDVVIFKERASALFGTPLVAHLTRLGADCLLVCGETTSGCVRASVVDAYSYGFHVAVVEDCTFDRSLLSHQVNLFDLHHKYADVMTLDEVAGHLGRSRAAGEVVRRG